MEKQNQQKCDVQWKWEGELFNKQLKNLVYN